MKTVYIVRHAKAEGVLTSDRDRKLTKAGIEDAKKMAKKLNMLGELPDYIVSSPARRALKTAKIFAEKFGYPVENIGLRDVIYESGPKDILRLIQRLDEKYQSVYIFGHNPVLSELANMLAINFDQNLPKCGIVALDFPNMKWKDVYELRGSLRLYASPGKEDRLEKQIRGYLEDDVYQALVHTVENNEPALRASLKSTMHKISKDFSRKYISQLGKQHEKIRANKVSSQALTETAPIGEKTDSK